MAKKSEPTATQEVSPAEALITFSYPTIGNGISIQARDQAEADAMAAKIKADLATS